MDQTAKTNSGPMMSPPKANILGIGLSAINPASALEAIKLALDKKNKGYVCLAGVHGVMEAQSDDSLRHIFNHAFLCAPDGMPMVWVGRLQGHKTVRRVYGPDLMLAVLALSEERRYRQFLYGGANGTVEILRQKLQHRFPRLQIVGTCQPPFRPLNSAEEKELIETVRAAKPDIIWVGISTPKQDRFMAEYLPKLDTTLMFGVGAAFDFHAGNIRQAPRWMQQSGLEWFFRLCCEPRRLWKRYFKNNPLFILRILGQITGLKKYSLND